MVARKAIELSNRKPPQGSLRLAFPLLSGILAPLVDGIEVVNHEDVLGNGTFGLSVWVLQFE